MEFLNKMKNLIQENRQNMIVRKNGTILLLPDDQIPYQHMLYAPLTDEQYEKRLISQYALDFPEDYLYFLRHINGVDLCRVRVRTPQFRFCHSLFIIFGVPVTPPFAREKEMEEPHDVRIEDLGRHEDIPREWLKCGTYIRDYNFKIQNDIFIDTNTQKVYACKRNEADVIDRWDGLDECFCSIYDSFNDRQLEYELEINTGDGSL